MVHVTLFTLTSVILSLTSSIVCKEPSRIPHAYVIEFERPVESFASKRHLEESRRIDFYQQLAQWNINYNIRHEYDVVNAVSLSFMSTQDSTLFFDNIQGYKKAWPVVSIDIACLSLIITKHTIHRIPLPNLRSFAQAPPIQSRLLPFSNITRPQASTMPDKS
jgi:hypothetical protein